VILEALPWGPPQNLYFALEVPAWGELNSLRLRDTDLLESVGINTFTGLSLDHFEGSKPYQLNHLSLFHTNFDGINDRCDRPFGFSLASIFSKLFLNRFD